MSVAACSNACADVLLGNLDVEANAAFRELFDLRLHEGHCVRRA
jgi:hypothetical protein